MEEKMCECCQKSAHLLNFQKVKAIVEKHGTDRSALIPILQEVQTEFRYLPQEMLSFIATAMGLTPADVFGVATFYAQFSTEPKGKHIVQICDGTACHVRGSGDVITAFRKKLEIPEGTTTSEDLWVTLETVSCLGACALAPAVVVDGKIYGHVKPDTVQSIIDEMKEGDA
jgi:NADH-quinone oxidoreductase subunit E